MTCPFACIAEGASSAQHDASSTVEKHVPTALMSLPDELLVSIAKLAHSAMDIGGLAKTSRRFGPQPSGELSIAEEALKARASERFRASAATCDRSWTPLTSAKILDRTMSAYQRSIRFPGSFGPMAMRFEARSNPTRIDIKTVSDEDGSEIFFRCRVYTMLGKLQAAFCQQHRLPDDGERQLIQQHVRFYYHGLLIKWDDTPASLNMQEDLAVIDVVNLPFGVIRHPATLRRGLSDLHKIRRTQEVEQVREEQEQEPRTAAEAAAPVTAEGTPPIGADTVRPDM